MSSSGIGVGDGVGLNAGTVDGAGVGETSGEPDGTGAVLGTMSEMPGKYGKRGLFGSSGRTGGVSGIVCTSQKVLGRMYFVSEVVYTYCCLMFSQIKKL